MPPNVREKPARALCVTCSSHCLTSTGVKADVTLQSDHPSHGRERPKQAGWEFEVEDLRFWV